MFKVPKAVAYERWKALARIGRSLLLLLVPLGLLLVLNSSSSSSSSKATKSINLSPTSRAHQPPEAKAKDVSHVTTSAASPPGIAASGNIKSSNSTTMRGTIVAFSDLHGLYLRDSLAVPTGDLLLCAGDIELRGDREWGLFTSYLKKQPHAHKVVSFGNMDMWTESLGADAPQWSEAKALNIHVIRDSIQEVAGYRILASPWTPKFYGAYQLTSDQQAEQHWAKVLPPDTEVDILITHGPPHMYGDTTRNRHVGDKALLKAVQALHTPPKLWVCGHIHDGRGVHKVPHPKGDILLINAAVAHLANNYPDIQPYIVDFGSSGEEGGPKVTVGPPPTKQTTKTP